MLRFPSGLSDEGFLRHHWQKAPLLMPGALAAVKPSLSRNDLAWLATQEDVESRIVFRHQDASRTHYHVEHGPFDDKTLQQLPKRNWTLLVNDVEKHVPAMRRLFQHVRFIPDWRIDDLMISFAAPGGGVGPHRDNYDVFLCQGIGVRRWSLSDKFIPEDPRASSDLQLLKEFHSDTRHNCTQGDILYLPPNVAHWGVAKRACMTYSIGMRAPLLSDIAQRLDLDVNDAARFYRDADLELREADPGLISSKATKRLCGQLAIPKSDQAAKVLGQTATETKPWLTPVTPSRNDVERLKASGRSLQLHGMARVAFDDKHVFVNGSAVPLRVEHRGPIALLCKNRRWPRIIVAQLRKNKHGAGFLADLADNGAFDLIDF